MNGIAHLLITPAQFIRHSQNPTKNMKEKTSSMRISYEVRIFPSISNLRPLWFGMDLH